jgi:hypothetical protein
MNKAPPVPDFKPIPLNGTRQNEHMKERAQYLVHGLGFWWFGQAHKNQYGWFINLGALSMNLDQFDGVYEMIPKDAD